jgi:hypothetical protein
MYCRQDWTGGSIAGLRIPVPSILMHTYSALPRQVRMGTNVISDIN